jgi:UDP-N-acetylglucosamine/UDP-N-acetylgalactosamine diphosphorylase
MNRCRSTFFFCSFFSFLSFFLLLPAGEKTPLQIEWQAMMNGGSEKDFDSYSPVNIDPSQSASHPYSPYFTKRVGFLLLAGGQGSRLGCEYPKGMVPIPPSGKTLFEIFLRRAVGFFNVYHQWPFCAIMTSQETDTETRKYLQENCYFGVPEKYVFLFSQTSLPLLNEKGETFSENNAPVTGPDGNGKVFSCFYNSGIYREWEKKGVEAVLVLPIDNPLMDPLLPALFQPVLEGKVKASFATLKRRSSSEKVGVFLKQKEHLHVVEYSEIPEVLRDAQKEDGSLVHAWANISVICLSMREIENISLVPLPLHFAKKMKGTSPIYKAEYFIFDNFPYIDSFSLISLDRTRYFSPIKSKTGEDSLEQASLAFHHIQEDQAKRIGLPLAEGEDASFCDPALLYIGN